MEILSLVILSLATTLAVWFMYFVLTPTLVTIAGLTYQIRTVFFLKKHVFVYAKAPNGGTIRYRYFFSSERVRDRFIDIFVKGYLQPRVVHDHMLVTRFFQPIASHPQYCSECNLIHDYQRGPDCPVKELLTEFYFDDISDKFGLTQTRDRTVATRKNSFGIVKLKEGFRVMSQGLDLEIPVGEVGRIYRTLEGKANAVNRSKK